MANLDYAQVKRFALLQLKGRWVLPLFIQVITSFVAAMFYCPIVANTAHLISSGMNGLQTIASPEDNMPAISMLLFLFAVRVFFVAEVEVYAAFTRGPEKVGFGTFIDGFADWTRSVAVTFWKGLLLYLWAMLLFFPAVIKFYSYYFAEYITAEFPAVSPFKAVGLSGRVTAGAKWQLFLLDVTLLPWLLLGMALSGVGLMWVMPYIRMTHINAFHALLKGAIKEGRVSLDELGILSGNEQQGNAKKEESANSGTANSNSTGGTDSTDGAGTASSTDTVSTGTGDTGTGDTGTGNTGTGSTASGDTAESGTGGNND